MAIPMGRGKSRWKGAAAKARDNRKRAPDKTQRAKARAASGGYRLERTDPTNDRLGARQARVRVRVTQWATHLGSGTSLAGDRGPGRRICDGRAALDRWRHRPVTLNEGLSRKG